MVKFDKASVVPLIPFDSIPTETIPLILLQAKNEMTNSNEIDELFAKVKVAQKMKTKKDKKLRA